MTLLCVVEKCRPFRGEHLPDCEGVDGRCRGCLPRPADLPLLVCRACTLRTEDQLTEIPGLRVDLLTPTRSRAGGRSSLEEPDRERAPATLAEVRSPAPDAALGERHELRDLIHRWTRYLIEHHGTPAWDLKTGAYRYVLEHAHLLLADEHQAAAFVGDLDDAIRRARAKAYPAGPPGQALGECPTCGTIVRADALTKATCRGCDTTRTIDEWHRVIAGDLTGTEAALGPDIRSWLAARHGREVSAVALRLWAHKGVRLAREDGSGRETVLLGRLGTDPYGRALYSVADARRIAAGLYGPPKTGISA